MKILAFAGSNSSFSINKKLVGYAVSHLKNCEINLLDLNDYEMPVYSIDREKKGFPEKATTFKQQITNCDAIVVSMAEHNRSYTVAFKNIFDWCSRLDSNFFQNKPMLLMSTSPGGFGGGNVMNAAKSIFPKFGAQIIETFSLPSFDQNFNSSTGITDPKLRSELDAKILSFKEKVGI